MSQQSEPAAAVTAKNAIWFCKIGETDRSALPRGSDAPMRDAIAAAYKTITGEAPTFIFSGWGGTLTEGERNVVDDVPADEILAIHALRSAHPNAQPRFEPIAQALAERRLDGHPITIEQQEQVCAALLRALAAAGTESREPLCEDEGCPNVGTPHVCFSRTAESTAPPAPAVEGQA